MRQKDTPRPEEEIQKSGRTARLPRGRDHQKTAIAPPGIGGRYTDIVHYPEQEKSVCRSAKPEKLPLQLHGQHSTGPLAQQEPVIQPGKNPHCH